MRAGAADPPGRERVLRDCLLATDDCDAAERRDAVEHDRFYAALHTAITVLYALGPDADRIREHALPMARGVGSDVIGKGPDCAIDDEDTRVQFLGR